GRRNAGGLAAVRGLPFAAANSYAVDQTDYWWPVKLGEGLWATGQLPAADPLALTSTRAPYVEQQWLAQLVLAAVHHLGGLEAALVLRAVLLVVTIALVFWACRRTPVGGGPAAPRRPRALLLLLPRPPTRPPRPALPPLVP